MARLVVNPGSSEAWEIELKPGANSLGRGQENDVPIEHASVSSSHCQLIVMGRNALLRDSGSVAGTFVEGQLVEETQLAPGQVFQLGSVEMRYESDESAGPAEALAAGAASGAGAVPRAPRLGPPAASCRSHPRAVARFACPKCGGHFCEACVSTRQSGGRAHRFCRACGVECAPTGARPGGVVPRERSFAEQLGGAFVYPFKGDGVILLAAGTIFYAIINAASFFAQFALLYGAVVILMLTGFAMGYLISYLRSIVASSAAGKEELPNWPDFTEFYGDIMAPFLQFLGTLLVCFLPALAVWLFVARDHPLAVPARVAAILFGCVWFPMAFLAVTMFDSLAALNPLLIFLSIIRIPVQYLLTVLLLAGLLVLRSTGQGLLERLLPIPILGGLVVGFAGLYLLTVEMRILGLLYLANADRLGWFGRSQSQDI